MKQEKKNTFSNLDKYILQIGQLEKKYILQFRQIEKKGKKIQKKAKVRWEQVLLPPFPKSPAICGMGPTATSRVRSVDTHHRFTPFSCGE